MNARNVCTGPTTHGRIVSTSFASLGASAYQIKNQLIDSQSAEGSKAQIRNPQSEIRNLLEVLDLMLINLIYPSTAGSSFYSVLWPSAKTPQSFRLSFALFVLFVVIPLLKSAFRNRPCAHETPVYRHLSRIIGFEISLFNSVLSPQSSVLVIDYRRLSQIIGFKIPLNFDRPKRLPSVPPSTTCTKFTILHKITQRDLHLKPLSTIHLPLNTTYTPHPPFVQIRSAQNQFQKQPKVQTSKSAFRNPQSAIAHVLTKPLIIGLYRVLSAFELHRKSSPKVEPACTKNTKMYKITQTFFDHVQAVITSAQRLSIKEMLKNSTPSHPSLLYKTGKFSFAPEFCREAF